MGACRCSFQRYPLVWQGMLALKNDQSYVQMHFVSGSMDLPTMALPSQTVYNGQTLPLRISQRMRLEPSNLEGVTKRMIVSGTSLACLFYNLPDDLCTMLFAGNNAEVAAVYRRTVRSM